MFPAIYAYWEVCWKPARNLEGKETIYEEVVVSIEIERNVFFKKNPMARTGNICIGISSSQFINGLGAKSLFFKSVACHLENVYSKEQL